MKIIVCIKQVPYIDQLKFDQSSKRIVREGVESEINPFDKRALTRAVELRRALGGEVVVVTMGPPQAKAALVEALAIGADRAVHLLGREFAGADTLATARTLALACRKIGYDLILCGKYSTDAETAQVPPMLAEFLDLPQITGATKLDVESGRATAVREMDDGFETLEAALPVVVSAAERLCKPAKVTPADLENAKTRPIETWGPQELAANPGAFGIAGSPTWVEEIDTIEPRRKRIVRRVEGDVGETVREVVRDLVAEGLFGEWKSRPRENIHPRKASGPSGARGAIWVLAETVEDRVRPATLELLGRAIQLAEKRKAEVAAILIGFNTTAHAKMLAAYGADTVYAADHRALADYATEPYATVLAAAIRAHDPFAVLIPSTANGRDLAPRVAARLGIGLTGDCIGLDIDDQGRLVQLKPAFGGNIVAPILSKTLPAMATVRPGMMQRAEPDFAREAVIQVLAWEPVSEPQIRIVSAETNAVAGVALDDAEIVIGVGMGLGSAENLAPIQALAELLHAPIGGTRRAVDSGWLPRQLQVGLTGRSISPRLYIAIGIGGKFNHVVGIQRSGLILAINNNPDADIFKQADYGIVGDWAQVVPALHQELKRARHGG